MDSTGLLIGESLEVPIAGFFAAPLASGTSERGLALAVAAKISFFTGTVGEFEIVSRFDAFFGTPLGAGLVCETGVEFMPGLVLLPELVGPLAVPFGLDTGLGPTLEAVALSDAAFPDDCLSNGVTFVPALSERELIEVLVEGGSIVLFTATLGTDNDLEELFAGTFGLEGGTRDERTSEDVVDLCGETVPLAFDCGFGGAFRF